MEKNKKEETVNVKMNGAIVLFTTFVMGYIFGRASNNKIAVESYKDGVSDTLKSIIFKQN